ncbi:MAG TPA: hypothetical protein VFU41_07120 [Gemmatimonadales bacterium]|nr:hypothetical protein [Gemmatimonadales bacterium]
MPVTAKLSRKFYDTFGDEIANELVEWFNQVDATYRSDLRELNKLNFARFDAKLEQRAAALEAKLEQRAAELEAKLEQLRAELRAEFQTGLASLEGRLLARLGVLEGGLIGRIGMVEGRLTRLTVLLWATLLATLVGLLRLL